MQNFVLHPVSEDRRGAVRSSYRSGIDISTEICRIVFIRQTCIPDFGRGGLDVCSDLRTFCPKVKDQAVILRYDFSTLRPPYQAVFLGEEK